MTSISSPPKFGGLYGLQYMCVDENENDLGLLDDRFEFHATETCTVSKTSFRDMFGTEIIQVGLTTAVQLPPGSTLRVRFTPGCFLPIYVAVLQIEPELGYVRHWLGIYQQLLEYIEYYREEPYGREA